MRCFVACSNANASSMRFGPLQAMPMKLTLNSGAWRPERMR